MTQTKLDRLRSSLRRHPWRVLFILIVSGFVTLNLVAYRHACAMMWFAPGGSRTVRPQQLSYLGKLNVLFTGVRIPRPENDRTPAALGLEFSTATIPVDSDVTLEAWLIPASAPRGSVILFHGYAASKSDLLPEAAAFHDLGFDAWLVDFRGSGGSSKRYTTIGVREADDVAAAIKHVRTATRPLLLYGTSMGAAAILRSFAECDVTADGVILESVFDRLLTTTGNRFRLMGLPASPGADLLIFWGGFAAGFDGRRHNPVDYASRCSYPTLMLHGDLDPNARLDEGRRVQRHMGDQSCELVVFANTGHSSTLAADAVQWRDAVRRFVSERMGLPEKSE